MNALVDPKAKCWRPLVSSEDYDRSPGLYPAEAAAIAQRLSSPTKYKLERTFHQAVERLLRPISDVAKTCDFCDTVERRGRNVLLEVMHTRQRSFFAWSEAQWLEVLQRPWPSIQGSRMFLTVLAYLLCDFRAIDAVPLRKYTTFARRVFTRPVADAANTRIARELEAMGYRTVGSRGGYITAGCVSYLMLLNESPYLEDMTPALLASAWQQPDLKRFLYRVSQALVALGVLEEPFIGRSYRSWRDASYEGLSPEWVSWCRRWRETTPVAPRSADSVYTILIRVGLWLRQEYPEVKAPADWTRAHCLDFLATVQALKVGDWVRDPRYIRQAVGKPIAPATKDGFISAVRTFFRDLQAWHWIPVRFAPAYDLKTPRSIARLIGTNPRVIEEQVWLKLVWASLHLSQEDVPINAPTGSWMYPFEMVRAVAVVWTHAGLRANEIARLALGCVRSQEEDLVDEQSGQRVPAGTLCYLHVPVSKTNTAFTKPVPAIVGEVIKSWEHVRPVQLPALDPKTGKMEHFLFSVRGRRISGYPYLNNTIIPMLCKKAGLARADARGPITSHRGRASAATLLSKTQGGMSLLDLMQWCGHTSPQTTMHYLGVEPTKLAKSFARADQSSRMIAVLIDQEAVVTGTAATGTPCTTIWGRAIARTCSGASVRIVWPVPDAPSTCPRVRRGGKPWRPKHSCSGIWKKCP